MCMYPVGSSMVLSVFVAETIMKPTCCSFFQHLKCAVETLDSSALS